MSDEIPEELITVILSKLQASSSIARFRCVCKSWRDLLSDPSFIRKNNLASPAYDHQFLIECVDRTGGDTRRVHRLHSPDTMEPLLPSPLQLPFDPHRARTPGARPNLSVVGSCNGLLCIIEYLRNDDDLILWNPTTSEFIVLPPSPAAEDLTPDFSFIGPVGFCFDSERDDYKIVRQFYFFDEDNRRCRSISVYSLRNNSWWRFPDGGCPPLSCWSIPQCRKGKLYWRHSEEESKSLVFDSFDIASQLFEVVEVRFDSEKQYGDPTYLLNEESMVVVFPEENHIEFDGKERRSRTWDVWVLLKYWEPESWMKLYVVANPPGMCICHCSGISSNLKLFFENIPADTIKRDRVFLADRTLIPFHLETGEFGDVQIEGTWIMFLTNYVSSRVSLRDYLPSSPNIINNVSDGLP